MTKFENAVIESTMIGKEDCGVMTFMIRIRSGSLNAAEGRYRLFAFTDRVKGEREYRSKGLEAISQILDVVGVDRWEHLKGRHIRIEDNEWTAITKIGNIMEDKWFDMKEFFPEGNYQH